MVSRIILEKTKSDNSYTILKEYRIIPRVLGGDFFFEGVIKFNKAKRAIQF